MTNSHPNGHFVFKTPVYISDLIDTVHPCQNWRTLAWPVWEHGDNTGHGDKGADVARG